MRVLAVCAAGVAVFAAPVIAEAVETQCQGSQKEVASCDLDPCIDHECLDCVWSEWSNYGPCTCEGLQDRHRTIAQQNNDCGKPCEGAKVQTRECEAPCHKPPQDCELSSWSAWSECDATCGGGQSFRSRTLVKEQHNGGDVCKGLLKETKACNVQPCEAETNCLVGEWVAWSTCSASCGGGQQFRHRNIEVHSSVGGKPCTDALTEVRGCSDMACEDQVDCVWGEWTEYGACTASCGGGMKVRDRSVAVAPRNGGKLCEAKNKTEVSACNTHACGSGCVDGVWEQWGEWTSCSAECDGGYTWRSREVALSPNHCGAPLEGFRQEFKPCNSQPCNQQAVDCEFSEWTNFGDCSCPCNGVKDRTRRVVQYPQNGGKLCEGALKEINACNEPGETSGCGAEVRDCVLSDWSDWGECTAECGGGTQRRSRTIVTPPAGSGIPCEGCLDEVRGCNSQACAGQVNCAWGEWHGWGACSKACGGGERTRFRHIVTMPKHGGASCDSKESAEIQPCNEQPCGTVEYCVWSQWSHFGECSATCGSGMKIRERHLVITSEKPADEESILVTGLLDSISNTFDGIDAGEAEHMVIFVSGMALSLGMLGVAYTFVRVGGRFGRRGNNTVTTAADDTTEFATLTNQEPFIE